MIKAESGRVPTVTIPHTEDPLCKGIYEAMKEGQSFYVKEMRGEALAEHARFMKTLPHFKEAVENLVYPEYLVYHTAYFAQGFLEFVTLQPVPEAEDVFLRFARVFEQTYTRFLDLNQAEEQAREAQIEAALERVRARAMAMRRSDELEEVVTRVFDAFESLNIDPGLINLGFVDDASNTWSIWNAMRTHEGYSVFEVVIPTFDHPLINNVTAAFERGHAMLVYEHAGEEKRRYDAHLFEHVDFPAVVKEAILSIDSLTGNFIFTKQGFLTAWRSQPLEDQEVTLLQRFANVIDLTYTRFDDLQQAEARAREATRQASLDRIRAEIASMRSAKDLERITPLFWRELTTLDVPFFRCGVFIVDELTQTTHTYLSTPDGTSLAVLHLPFEGVSLIEEIIGHWRKRTSYTTEWDAQQFAAFGAELVEKGFLDSTEAYQGSSEPPECLVLHFLPFTQGMLYVGSATPLTKDQIDLVQILADTFSVAYARYEDFTKLEAAKAQIEATLAELQTTQAQLIQQEKMASLGQLTAGIAHEIKNPLNFVNNFSSLISDLVGELRSDPDARIGDELELIDILAMNAQKINEHGHRANRIVESMMQHASWARGERQSIPVNAFVDEYVNLAFHGWETRRVSVNRMPKPLNTTDTAGLRGEKMSEPLTTTGTAGLRGEKMSEPLTTTDTADLRGNRMPEPLKTTDTAGLRGEKMPEPLNTTDTAGLRGDTTGLRGEMISEPPGTNEAMSLQVVRDYDEAAGEVELVPQDIGQVLVNLFNNAFDAMLEQKGRLDGAYKARLVVSTLRKDGAVQIRVSDNGAGIPDQVRDKIFEPFFTTKPTGSGTGLGLSLSYDIVTQGHGGSLTVESEKGEGAMFVIMLPVKRG